VYLSVLKEIAWCDMTSEERMSEVVIWEMFHNTLRMYLNQELIILVL